MPACQVRALTEEMKSVFGAGNSLSLGFWKKAPVTLGACAFRIVNNTHTCDGPWLAIFRDGRVPALQWAEMPESWSVSGIVPLSIGKGTLVPSSGLARWRAAKASNMWGRQAEETSEHATARAVPGPDTAADRPPADAVQLSETRKRPFPTEAEGGPDGTPQTVLPAPGPVALSSDHANPFAQPLRARNSLQTGSDSSSSISGQSRSSTTPLSDSPPLTVQKASDAAIGGACNRGMRAASHGLLTGDVGVGGADAGTGDWSCHLDELRQAIASMRDASNRVLSMGGIMPAAGRTVLERMVARYEEDLRCIEKPQLCAAAPMSRPGGGTSNTALGYMNPVGSNEAPPDVRCNSDLATLDGHTVDCAGSGASAAPGSDSAVAAIPPLAAMAAVAGSGASATSAAPAFGADMGVKMCPSSNTGTGIHTGVAQTASLPTTIAYPLPTPFHSTVLTAVAYPLHTAMADPVPRRKAVPAQPPYLEAGSQGSQSTLAHVEAEGSVTKGASKAVLARALERSVQTATPPVDARSCASSDAPISPQLAGREPALPTGPESGRLEVCGRAIARDRGHVLCCAL